MSRLTITAATAAAGQKKWDESNLPSFDQLPTKHGLKGCAWDVWGKGDQLGTVNLLTDENTARASREEIQTGKSICLNWPIQFPALATVHRMAPEVKLKPVQGVEAYPICDEEIHMNTQSGTQWDGLRHFGIFSGDCFYGGHARESIKMGAHTFEDPLTIDQESITLGIHNWAQHGISGRGVLLDLVNYYLERDGKLPYHPHSTHGIPLADIKDCAKKQGVTFRQADILLLRMGYTQAYYAASAEEKKVLGSPGGFNFAGVENTEEMKVFLWDNHFAAVASDQPGFEALPPKFESGECWLHETLIGLWGCPIGEFFDLEVLAKHCAREKRWTFFFSSWPLNILGGAASPPNAAAYF